MENIEQEVLQWHSEIFPNATLEAIESKLDEETGEFLSEYEYPIDNETFEVEFADMCIVFISRQKKLNRRPLSQVIADKLVILKARKWGPELPDGNRVKI